MLNQIKSRGYIDKLAGPVIIKHNLNGIYYAMKNLFINNNNKNKLDT